jgi:thiol:disulfide interchange protein
MIRFKELMGFLLVLTLVWLLYTFGQMSGNYALSMLLLLFTAWGMAFWAWGWLPWTSITAAKIWPKNLTALILFALSVWFVQHQLWPAMQEHDAQQLAKQSAPETQNLAEGHDVFVDFTADWCISCHANEKVALEPQEVDQHFRAGKPIFLIGDYTRKDPRITAELKKFGRSGVPMYVLYKANGQTVVLPETLTPQIVLDAIQ